MTYGQLRFRLTKAFPGVDADLIEGWISDRYDEILGELPWQRLNKDSVLETIASYTTGTVQVTKGSQAVTLTGGTWTAGMTGRSFRVAGQTAFYTFTQTGAGTGTLDRIYEGSSGSGLSYAIYQAVYTLPSDCRQLNDSAFETTSLGPLTRLTRAQLNLSFPDRSVTGTPLYWASTMDDTSTPPRMQVELVPYPDSAIGLPFEYVADGAPWSTASAPSLAWIQDAALVEGVTAKIKSHLKDYTGAALHTAAAERALKNMRTSEAQGMAPAQMQLSSYFTRHRRHRGGCR